MTGIASDYDINNPKTYGYHCIHCGAKAGEGDKGFIFSCDCNQNSTKENLSTSQNKCGHCNKTIGTNDAPQSDIDDVCWYCQKSKENIMTEEVEDYQEPWDMEVITDYIKFDQEKAFRAMKCVNALKGCPDPQKFVDLTRALIEANADRGQINNNVLSNDAFSWLKAGK